MGYTNTFLDKLEDNLSLVPGTGKTYHQLYESIIQVTRFSDLSTLNHALTIMDDASKGFRLAAAHGDAKTLISIYLMMRMLARTIQSSIEANATNQAFINILLSRIPQTQEKYSLTHSFLLKPSTNGRNALAWAFYESYTNKKQIDNQCEYAVCVSILLHMGFQLKDLPKNDRLSASHEQIPLYSFITRFNDYKKIHQFINFDTAFCTNASEIGFSKGFRSQAMHALTAHYFMQSHRTSLEAFAQRLKENKVNKINVVEIGCAVAEHLPILMDFFNSHHIALDYTGYDVSNDLIEIAKAVIPKAPGNNIVRFECKDAAMLKDIKEYQGKFHLVLFRHPDVLNPSSGEKFKDMIAITSRYLIEPEQGMLMISTYFDREVNVINALLQLETKGLKFVDNPSPLALFPNGIFPASPDGANERYQPERFGLAMPARLLLENKPGAGSRAVQGKQ